MTRFNSLPLVDIGYVAKPDTIVTISIAIVSFMISVVAALSLDSTTIL